MQPKIQKHTTWKFCQSISGASVIYMVRTLSHNIIWSFACHTRKTYDLLKLWTSLYEMWQTWWAGCLCDSHSVSVWTVCVWLCVHVFGCDRGVSRLPRPRWMGHCVSLCVCVCVCSCGNSRIVHLFSHWCRISFTLIFGCPHHCTIQQTNKHRALYWMLQDLFHSIYVLQQSLLFHLPDASTPDRPLIISESRTSSTTGPFHDSHRPSSGSLLSLQTRDYD